MTVRSRVIKFVDIKINHLLKKDNVSGDSHEVRTARLERLREREGYGKVTGRLEQLNNPDIGKAKRTTRLQLGPKSC